MGRRRTEPPTFEAVRARAYRARRLAGLQSFRLDVDVELARRRFPDARDDDVLRAYLEELLDDTLTT